MTCVRDVEVGGGEGRRKRKEVKGGGGRGVETRVRDGKEAEEEKKETRGALALCIKRITGSMKVEPQSKQIAGH